MAEIVVSGGKVKVGGREFFRGTASLVERSPECATQADWEEWAEEAVAGLEDLEGSAASIASLKGAVTRKTNQVTALQREVAKLTKEVAVKRSRSSRTSRKQEGEEE